MSDAFEPLDKEEKELIAEIDRNEWQPVADEKRKELLEVSKTAGTNTRNKTERMNIRISESDMLRLKAKAIEKGIPYQTLLTELIHEYVHRT
jgi:predicted DNA binding CopG/RHH family protein